MGFGDGILDEGRAAPSGVVATPTLATAPRPSPCLTVEERANFWRAKYGIGPKVALGPRAFPRCPEHGIVEPRRVNVGDGIAWMLCPVCSAHLGELGSRNVK